MVLCLCEMFVWIFCVDGRSRYLCSVLIIIIIIFILSPISNVHRNTSYVDYTKITYIYNN